MIDRTYFIYKYLNVEPSDGKNPPRSKVEDLMMWNHYARKHKYPVECQSELEIHYCHLNSESSNYPKKNGGEVCFFNIYGN